GNTEGNGVKVEAWLIKEGESKESVLEKVKAGTYDKENGGYYSYQPSSKSATSCQISSLNIDEQGEYVLTVTVLGDDNGIYDTIGPVSGEKTIFTVRRLADVLQADGAVTPQGEKAYAELSYINGKNDLYDAVKLYISKSYLDIADTFRLVLSSYNAVSSNALNDISVNINIEQEEGEYKVSDTNGGSSIVDNGSYVVITYELDKLFHGKDDDGNITHIQSNDASNPAYGRYFKVAVQASNGKTESGQETAYIAGGAATLNNFYLSYCKPENDGNERFFIKTEYAKDGDEVSAQVESFAFAQLMYIQALMLSGDDCLGKTFIINENLDARNNPWLSLEGFAGTLTSGKATYTAPDDSQIDENGNYYISNLNIRNAGAIDYENKEEDAKELPSFGKNYGFFASIASSGRISGVNFINVTATDSNYVLEYKENAGDDEEDKKVNLYTDYAGIIAGINNGSVLNVYVSGTLSGHNTLGGAIGLNNGGASLKAVESAVTVSSTGVKESPLLVGGLVGSNNGHI
ncbi:MAG: hypothetical protein K2I79_02485, partial [Clostridia bacterium]|nr:hypothetical protein [Clostridia bacterium]